MEPLSGTLGGAGAGAAGGGAGAGAGGGRTMTTGGGAGGGGGLWAPTCANESVSAPKKTVKRTNFLNALIYPTAGCAKKELFCQS